MAKPKKLARKKTAKSVKANPKRKSMGKRSTQKPKSKARRASKPAKRAKPAERKGAPSAAPIEMTIVAVEQPAPGVLVVEEVSTRT